MSNDSVSVEVTQKNLVMSNRITSYVVMGSLLMSLMLVGLLFMQLYDLNQDPKTEALSVLKTAEFSSAPDAVQSDFALLLLEHDAQHLRTKRAQSLVGARLFVQSIAVIAGISLLVMGSSIVFARIKTTPSQINAQNNSSSFSFGTSSPGLILALFGTVLIVSALTVSLYSKTLTTDVPVFLGKTSNVGSPQGNRLSPEEQKAAWAGVQARVEDQSEAE